MNPSLTRIRIPTCMNINIRTAFNVYPIEPQPTMKGSHSQLYSDFC